MPEYSVVGKRVPRIDALKKVTGEAIYSGDVMLGCANLKLIR